MDNYHQQRSNEKKSVTSSEGRRKKRPSLIPLRNSATRKSQVCENNHFHDGMSFQTEQKNEAFQPRQSGATANWSVKSENQHNLRTPSEHHSIYSSPRTPRSSPKNFESEIPFVPFVHQSLTRTVWESEEIIPQQKEDIERKESQTGFNSKNNPHEFEAKDHIMEDQTSMESSNQNLFSLNFTRSPSKIIQKCLSQGADTFDQKKENNFKKELEISLPVITSITPLEDFKQSSDVKLEPFFENKESNMVLEVTHQEYVSKAPIYYQQEVMASAKKSERQNNNRDQMVVGKRGWQRFSFSYLQTVSIRPVMRQQENDNVIFDKLGTKTQNFKIANPMFERVGSSKKNNVQNQTNFNERLLAISKGYQEKIGFEREIIKNAVIQSVDKSIQTEQRSNIQNQFDAVKQTIKDFPQKDYPSHKQQIEKNALGEEDQKENQNVQEKGVIQQSVKVLKSFACQYDQNDVGMKPSIKRVSIADSKKNVIFDFSSTRETEDKKSKNKKKEKKQSKSKPKDKVEPTKAKKEQQKAQAEPEERTRKSKRNISRNEAKKARA